MHEVRLARPAGPLLHQLQLLALELRDGREEELRVLVLELHDFLGRLEEEGRLAVRERYDGALCQISANEQENFRSVECWAMMVKLFKKFIDSTAILTLSMSLGSPMTTAPARLRLI